MEGTKVPGTKVVAYAPHLLVSRISSLGVYSLLRTEQDDTGAWVSVRIGTYANREEAIAAAESERARLKLVLGIPYVAIHS